MIDARNALAPPRCKCERPVADQYACCITCGRHITSIRCDGCKGRDDLEIEHHGDGLVTIRCHDCRLVGKRPTSARHRRIVSITPLPDLLAGAATTPSDGER